MRRDEFVEKHAIFALGNLPTEQPHALTQELSRLAQQSPGKGFEVLRNVDLLALGKLQPLMPRVSEMRQQIQSTINSGGRVFLCGCGATGRLSLTLEKLWREISRDSEQVVAFMAGGDIALVHSLEGFEDYPEYGARHLLQLGFSENDLLISCTEGGETPYVIGATEKAAEVSKRKPFFLYCNPTEVLHKHVGRSRKVFENCNITSIELSTGPMALAGSTRMQASTVLQLFVGYALLFDDNKDLERLQAMIDVYNKINLTDFAAFVEDESSAYERGHKLLYEVSDYAITVFTDTTERAPTFSLMPFEPDDAEREPSLCYIRLPQAKSVADSWKQLLGRAPRSLQWEEIEHRTSVEYLQKFDFGCMAKDKRQNRLGKSKQIIFDVSKTDSGILWRLGDNELLIKELSGSHLLEQHLVLKMLLNAHSTLVMGRLGRYVDNLMTWVFPTNGKLIDRATRYIQQLLNNRGVQSPEYLSIAHSIYDEMEKEPHGTSVVMTVLDKILQQRQAG